jgi:hypothetical protein
MDRATLIARFLARAEENLQAAQLLEEAGLLNACVTWAYFAVFQALNSALAQAGRSPAPGHEHWNHRALQASVHELTDRRKVALAQQEGAASTPPAVAGTGTAGEGAPAADAACPGGKGPGTGHGQDAGFLSSLTQEQRKALVEEMKGMTPKQRKEFLKIKREAWLATLTPAQKAEFEAKQQARKEKLEAMTPEQREALRAKRQEWKNMTPEQRGEMRTKRQAERQQRGTGAGLGAGMGMGGARGGAAAGGLGGGGRRRGR